MLVRCTANDIRSVPGHSFLGQELKRWFGTANGHVALEIGRLYVVYGVHLNHGWLRYFIADEDYSATRYPLSYFASFFDLVDQRLSRCWAFGFGSAAERCTDIMLTFPEWTSDPSFYERLIDGDSEAQRIFRQKKEFMDFEFPDPSISDAADILDDDWFLCTKCDEAFKPKGGTAC